MPKHANVRIEARKENFSNQTDKERAFKGMLSAFKRAVNNSGVLTEFNQRQSYESRGQKLRRKGKESGMRRKHENLQDKLRDHFGQG